MYENKEKLQQSIKLVLKETVNEIALESAQAYNRNGQNGYQTITLDLNCINGKHKDTLTKFKDIKSDITKLTSLTLSHCDLKEVPVCLCSLLLKNLDLSHNFLNAAPKCLDIGLFHVENLNLAHNAIVDFSTKPKCVTKLQILNLEQNKLTVIPSWILLVKCTNLREFYFSYNEVNSTNNSEFQRVAMYELKKLVLKNCRITSANVDFVKSIRGLTYLNVSNEAPMNRNGLRDYEELFVGACWLANLNVLNLSGLLLSFVPDSISLLANLKELYMANNDLCWLPDSISDLVHLEIIDVSKNLIGQLPSRFGNLSMLHTLNLQYNSIVEIPGISDLVSLRVLDMYSNYLSSFDVGIDYFEWIDLEQNYMETLPLGQEYVDKRDSYRQCNEAEDRSYGAQECSEQEYWQPYRASFCADDDDFSNVSDCCNEFRLEEEENWDIKQKSHPEVTTSDDEWAGYVEVVKKRVNTVSSAAKDLEMLFVDAD